MQERGVSQRFGQQCNLVTLETHSGGAIETLSVGFALSDGFPRWAEIELMSSEGAPLLRVTERFVEIEIDGTLPENAFTTDVPEDFTELPALDPSAPMRQITSESE
jgi:hypothetical protein